MFNRIFFLIFFLLIPSIGFTSPMGSIVGVGCSVRVFHRGAYDFTAEGYYTTIDEHCSGYTLDGSSSVLMYETTISTWDCTASGWENESVADLSTSFSSHVGYVVKTYESFVSIEVDELKLPVCGGTLPGTCFDGFLNQDEFYADCGLFGVGPDVAGICPPCDVCQPTIDAFAASCPLGLVYSEPNCVDFDGECLVNNCDSLITEFNYATQCPEPSGFTCDDAAPVVPLTAYNPTGSAITSFGCCSDELTAWKAANCSPGDTVLDFDCVAKTGTCSQPNCSTLQQDCYDGCGGQVSRFSCLDINGVPDIIESCLCTDGNPPDDTPLDDTPEEADPDDLDNALLQKIVNNTAATVTNTVAIANKLDVISTDIKSSAISNSISADKLTGIKSDTQSIRNSTSLTAANTTTIKNDTAIIKDNTTTIKDKITDVFNWMNEEYLGVDSDVQSAENMIVVNGNAVIDDTGQSVDTAVQDEIDLISTDIDSIINNPQLGESLFNGVFTPFTSMFPSSQDCIPFEGNFPSLPEANYTIPCAWSDNFKLVFAWFLSVMTLFYLYHTLTTRIVPN